LYFCILAALFSFESGATLFSTRVIRFAHPYLFRKGLLPSAMCSRFTRVSHSATSPYLETLPLYSGLKLMFDAFKRHLDPNDAAGLNQRAA